MVKKIVHITQFLVNFREKINETINKFHESLNEESEYIEGEISQIEAKMKNQVLKWKKIFDRFLLKTHWKR